MGTNVSSKVYSESGLSSSSFSRPGYITKQQTKYGIWNCGIIFYVIKVDSKGLREMIRTAIKDSNSKLSNVKWVEKTSKHNKLAILDSKNVVIFVQNNQSTPYSEGPQVGCHTGPQIISLCYPYYPGSTRKLGNACILHEMMHAMGFEHEHSRIDRDKHVSIDSEYKENFQNLKRGVPLGKYDFLSVMHYGEGACGVRVPKQWKSKVDNPKYVKSYSKTDIKCVDKVYFLEAIRWVARLYVTTIVSNNQKADEWAKKYGLDDEMISIASKANSVKQLYNVLIKNGISDRDIKWVIWSAMYDIINDYHNLPYLR